MDLLGLTAARPFFGAAAARAGHDLALYATLAGATDGLSRDEIARAIGAAPRRLGALLDVLALDGWLVRDGGVGDRAAARYRLRATPPTTEIVREGWGRLAEVLRADRPLDEPGIAGAPGRDDDRLARFHAHLAAAARAPARALFDSPGGRLASDGAAGSLLDLGAGAGAWSSAWLDGDPARRATLVDRADVLALARAALPPSRSSFVAGDLFDAPLGKGHGVALLAHVLHLFPLGACARLVERAAAALAPGGRLVTVDLAVAADRSGPPAGVLFALNMALYTDGGDVHDAEEIGRLLDGAGLAVAPPFALAEAPDLHVLVGEKAAAGA